MKYNVAQLLKGPPGLTRHYEMTEEIESLDEGIKATSPLAGPVNFTRTPDGILATGKFRVRVDLECVRCLRNFVSEVGVELEEEFRPTVDVVSGKSLPIPDGWERANLIDASHTIDLTEVLRQNLLVALPTYPHCRPDCAGLCPQCGKDLNEGPCDCTPPLDPRLSVLASLLKVKEGEE